MLSKKQIGQPSRQKEHFSFSYQLLVFFLVSTIPHGWERLASRGDACSRESRIYQGRGQTRRYLGKFLFTEQVLAKVLTLDMLWLKKMSEWDCSINAC